MCIEAASARCTVPLNVLVTVPAIAGAAHMPCWPRRVPSGRACSGYKMSTMAANHKLLSVVYDDLCDLKRCGWQFQDQATT